jgi:hypothetical protein
VKAFLKIILNKKKEEGFGQAKGNRSDLILVPNYLPPGNISKSYEKNVLSPMK